jgi:hypothetical protein
MTDQFTQVTSQGFLSRIVGSIVGFLFGPLVVIGAIVLLSWNEGRAVQALSGLGEAAHATVEADANAALPANEGKLVHLSGPATASAAISDPDLGIDFKDQVTVARTAQMYQWRETKQQRTQDQLGGGQTTVTTYSYEKVWSDQPIDSSHFQHPEGHANPAMPLGDARWAASDAKLGAYTLGADTLKLATLSTALQPDAPDGWTAANGALEKGDPAAPQVGDLKVTYLGLATGSPLSILARQSSGGFAPFVTRNGYQLEIVKTGFEPAAQMIAEKRKDETTLTWILRGVGFAAMAIGFAMFLGPLSTFAAVIPLLGSIARGASFLAALVIAAPLTLVVIAISWIAFRPLVGVGLLVAAAVVLWALRSLHQSRHPAAAAAPA